MSLSENYQCDVCGTKKGAKEQWWLIWLECSSGNGTAGDRKIFKLLAWQTEPAHTPGVKHLCGARCVGTMMDRWMSEQHENPDAQCGNGSLQSRT